MRTERADKRKKQVKYNGFMDLLDAFWGDDPARTAFLYEKSGEVASLSRGAFAGAVLARRDELPEAFGTGTCLGVLCDGSLSCVLTIFAAVLAGMQVVLLDENAAALFDGWAYSRRRGGAGSRTGRSVRCAPHSLLYVRYDLQL